MGGERSERHPLDLLGEEFVARYRRGERPSVTEFARRYPDFADQIEELLQALALMEEMGPASAASGGSPATAAAPKAPQQLGDYRIVREMGRGGMGVVYEAVQESLGRRVALKVLPFHAVIDPTHLERFRREAKAAARLHHTNIVPVFGVGEHNGIHYYVMQFIQGRGLDEVLIEVGKLCTTPKVLDTSPSETTPELSTLSETGQRYFQSAARLGIQVAEALAYAHRQGIVHRDIKPGNLILDAQGTVWVADFGLARSEGLSNLTQDGDILGTFRYMAPERFDRRSDPRGDVYSLGLTLYEILTLRPAFAETDRNLLIKQLTQTEPPRPRQLDRTIPHDLETIVLKAIEKEPDHRYQSAEELAEDLRRFLADLPIRARRIGVRERAWRWCRRNPLLALSTAAAVALLVVLAVGGTLTSVLLRNERDAASFHAGEADKNFLAAKDQERLAHISAADARRQERLAQHNLYAAHIHVIEQSLERGDMRQALALLEGQRPRPGQEDLRGFEWYYLWRLCHLGHRLTLRGHAGPVVSVAYSPAGALLASGGDDGAIILWDMPSGRVRCTGRGHSGPVRSLAFSPDGQILASGSDDQTIKFWQSDTGSEKVTLRGHEGSVLSVAFSPDGALLASGGNDLNIRLWDAVTGRERPGPRDNWSTRAVAFSPDGRTLVSGDSLGSVKVWDVATRRRRAAPRVHRFGIFSLAFAPDGKTLASASEDRSVVLWDTTTWQMQRAFEDHISSVTSVAFSPDGKLLFCGTSAGPIKVWDLVTGQARVYGNKGRTQLAISPDGTHWVSASQDRTIKLWDMPTDLSPPPKQGPRQLVFTVAFSPDGRTVASAGDGPIIKLWDTATGQLRDALRGPPVTVRSVMFAPDGRSLASGNEGGVLTLWDVATRQERWTAKHSRRVNTVAFAPDGLTVASASLDGAIRFWDVATGVERTCLREDGRGFSMCAFSPSGRTLASLSIDGKVTFWETASGAKLAFHDLQASRLAYAPDGKTLALGHGGDYEVTLWDVATARPRVTVQLPEVRARLVEFAPDSRTLVVANWDGTLAFVGVATGRVRATLADSRHWVYALAFSPDGQILATGGWDGTVKFWRAATETEVLAQSSVGLGELTPKPATK